MMKKILTSMMLGAFVFGISGGVANQVSAAPVHNVSYQATADMKYYGLKEDIKKYENMKRDDKKGQVNESLRKRK